VHTDSSARAYHALPAKATPVEPHEEQSSKCAATPAAALDPRTKPWLLGAVFSIRLTSLAIAPLLCALLLNRIAGADSGVPSKVERLLAQLSAKPENAARTSEERAQAQAALTRAKQARADGDKAHLAALHEDVALEWAALAEDTLMAREREAKAMAAEQSLLEATQQVRRAEAFLEETEARRGRALAQLQKAPAASETRVAPPKQPSTPPAGAVRQD
jgi:hypothetical protein